MPSLPSERLLSGYCDSEAGLSESVSVSQIGKAVTVDGPTVQGGRFEDEQLQLDPPTRRAPSPPNLDKSLPHKPDTPVHDRVMKSVELEVEEANTSDVEAPAAETECPPVQSVKFRQVQVMQQSAASGTHLSDEDDPSELSDPEDSDFEHSESGRHETSPEPSKSSNLAVPKPSIKPRSTKPQASKSKKRKSVSDCDPTGEKTFQPVPESESDISSVKPKPAPKKTTTGNPPRKLQKTSNSKTSPPNKRHGAPSRDQLTTGRKHSPVSSKSSKSKIPAKGGRQSVSPPPSGPFTGLEYMKPSSQSSGNGTEVGEARMATYSAIPSADGDDVPPMPKMPKAVRLASGEVVNIPAPKNDGNGGAGKLQHTGSNASKLTKARPTPSPRKGGEEKKSSSPKKGGKKEEFEWPEDVF